MGAMYLHSNRPKTFLILGIGVAIWLVACTKDKPVVTPAGPTPMELTIPPFFPKPYLNPDNPLTYEGVKLGKKLYNDAILSSNGLSCSSCHNKDLSYSTPLFTDKNGASTSVPPHVNLAFNPNYNWNGSLPILDTLCMGDFEPEFFNTNRDTLYRRLSTHAEYPGLFRDAFGIKNINDLEYRALKLKICYAISQHIRTLISADSKFDRYVMNTVNLNAMETEGMSIFFSEKGDCFHCHGAPLFTDNIFHNNGINASFTGLDQGRFLVTGDPKHLGLFSSPTLRNIEYTAPYMHDGRFATLEEVVEFYNSGVKHSETLDPLMTKNNKLTGLQLTDYQKKCLVAFLKTLSDPAFIGE